MTPQFALFIILLLSLLLGACGQQSAPTATPVNVDMSVRVEPEPLAVGEAMLIVSLKDVSGSSINGATIQARGDMDHEGMVPVVGEVGESTNGEYHVPFEWTMGGGWFVTITAQLPDNGGEISETFDFFVEAASSDSIINRNSDMEMADDTIIDIVYTPDNDPAIGGDATIMITLLAADGSPVTDATVEVTGTMAHDDMLPVNGIGEHMEDGQYVVPLRWTMAGDWLLTVQVTTADDNQIEQSFTQEVVMP